MNQLKNLENCQKTKNCINFKNQLNQEKKLSKNRNSLKLNAKKNGPSFLTLKAKTIFNYL